MRRQGVMRALRKYGVKAQRFNERVIKKYDVRALRNFKKEIGGCILFF